MASSSAARIPWASGLYLLSDETFEDFELQLEARPDWPVDTGILVADGSGAQHRHSGSAGSPPTWRHRRLLRQRPGRLSRLRIFLQRGEGSGWPPAAVDRRKADGSRPRGCRSILPRRPRCFSKSGTRPLGTIFESVPWASYLTSPPGSMGKRSAPWTPPGSDCRTSIPKSCSTRSAAPATSLSRCTTTTVAWATTVGRPEQCAGGAISRSRGFPPSIRRGDDDLVCRIFVGQSITCRQPRSVVHQP